MQYTGLDKLLQSGALARAKEPVAVIIAEDDVEVDTTLRHHKYCGFATILLFAPPEIELPEDALSEVIRVDFPTLSENACVTIMNAIVSAVPPKTWLYYCYNAEYLFFPFSETRSISELLTFHGEERRSGMLTYIVDIYAGDLSAAPNAVSLEDAHLDKSGYYALARTGENGSFKERQLDFFGGLRWRFEEHIADTRRRIDRIAIVRAQPGMTLRPDHTWSEEELNTYACPWHNNLTATICSFRTAKALRSNPASRFEIDKFRWHNSVAFEWHSRQLLDLGLMETGQWF